MKPNLNLVRREAGRVIYQDRFREPVKSFDLMVLGASFSMSIDSVVGATNPARMVALCDISVSLHSVLILSINLPGGRSETPPRS